MKQLRIHSLISPIRRMLLSIIFASFFLLIPCFNLIHSSVYAAVVINELFPKPSDEVSEWIELYNNGVDVVDLGGWKLENTNGDKKVYTFTPGTVIQPYTFLTVFQRQTSISLNNGGDTVKLINANNSEADSKGFPSTIGYNYSMGRDGDGGQIWALCTEATFNKPNICPAPAPTATPWPTQAPTSIPTQVILPTDTPTPTINPVAVTSTPESTETMIISPKTLGASISITPSVAITPVPTQFMESRDYWTRWAVGLMGGVAIGCILFFYGILKSQ